MKCHSEAISDSSVQVEWNSSYPECFNFDIMVNGTVMQSVNASGTKYIERINGLSPNAKYNVCVVARSGLGMTERDWIHCDNIFTNATTGGKMKVERKLIHWPIATLPLPHM